MDAGQLFEQLQVKSKQNSNDIAVVLDAVITTIIEKVNSGQSVEFADFGHFKKSEYDKLDFEVSGSFAKIINYKYDGMESVPLSDSDKSALLQQPEYPTATELPADSLQHSPAGIQADDDSLSDFVMPSESSFEEQTEEFISNPEPEIEPQPVSEDRIVLPEPPAAVYENEEPDEYKIDVPEIVNETSDAINEEKPDDSVSSYVTEILDDIQNQQEEIKPAQAPAPSFYERDEPVALPNIRKLDTVIVEESLNEKKKEMPMQSYTSTGYQEPKRQEVPDEDQYTGSGLSNSELGNDTDGSKKWMLILGIAIIGVAIGFWVFFHLDTKDSSKPLTDSDTTQSEIVDSTALTGSNEPVVDPFEDTSAPVEATPVKNTKKSKTAAKETKTKEVKKETKTAAKPAVTSNKTVAKKEAVKSAPVKSAPVKKSEPVSNQSVSSPSSIDYDGIGNISGLKGTFEQSKGGYTITVSSWAKKTQAERELKKWTDVGVAASISEVYLADKNGYWYRVRIGQFKTRKEASATANEVKNELPGVYVVDAAAD